MRILILGGGSVGGKLALDLRDPFVLIESDPSRVWELKDILKDNPVDHEIVHGDGSSLATIEGMERNFDTAVVLMNRDSENLEAVSVLKRTGVKRIIARVNLSENMSRFIEQGAEVFGHPIGYEEGLIRTMLYPDTSHALQIFVREGSPAIGKTIGELDLPPGAVIGSILREDRMIPPEKSTIINNGDLIAVDTVGKRAPKIWKIFSRSGKVESSGHLLFPLSRDRDLHAIKELELLARRLGSRIVFILQPGEEELLTSARGFISNRIPYEVISCSKDDECLPEGDSKMIRWRSRSGRDLQIRSIMSEHMKEGSPHIDMLVAAAPRSTFIYFPFLPTNFDRMIEKAPMPVLVSRNQKPYREILMYIHRNSAFEINMAIRLARATGARITALIKPRNKKKAQYLQRFAQVYKVKVETVRIMGNPTVEMIREIKENHYDLVIFKNKLRDLQMTQMRRIIHLWTGSVLVVP